MQYFVVMIDYGRGPERPMGLEALPVKPELTRRQIVEQVRDILASDTLSLVHVKFIDGNYCEDVTEELKGEASYENAMAAIDAVLSPADRQAAAFDHARDLRKHEGYLR